MASRTQLQSLRSSCERCRFHKLKCTLVPNAPPQEPPSCVRCARAKADCVFSRRAPGKRQSPSLCHSESRWSSTSCTTQQPVSESQSRLSPFLIEPVTTDAPKDSCNSEPDLNADQLGPVCHISREDHFFDDITNSELIEEGFLSSGPLSSFEIQAPQLFALHGDRTEKAKLDPIPDVQRENIQTNAPNASGCKKLDFVLQISALVGNIHNIFDVLQSSWGSLHSLNALDDYPVGSILQLSECLTSLLENMPRSQAAQHNSSSWMNSGASSFSDFSVLLEECTSASQPTAEPGAQSRINPPVLGFSDEIDTSTRLLILSCYTSLTKLYGLVLSQLHSHLNAVPEAFPDSEFSHMSPSQRREIRLGELPLSDDTRSKACTAVRLLLGALQAAEDVIGIPTALRAVRAFPFKNWGGNELKDQSMDLCIDFLGRLSRELFHV